MHKAVRITKIAAQRATRHAPCRDLRVGDSAAARVLGVPSLTLVGVCFDEIVVNTVPFCTALTRLNCDEIALVSEDVEASNR